MKRLAVALSIALALLPGHGIAQELTPRAYWPAPKGTQLITAGYSYVSGDIVPDPSLPITGVDSKISSLQVGYLRTVELFGRTSNIVFEVPYSDGTTQGQGDLDIDLKREYRGFGDVSATVSVNFLGAPSMNHEQFADLRRDPHLIVGGSLKVVAPTGKYDSNRLVNVGANRWAAKAEVGMVAPLSTKWLLEAALGMWVFQDNDDFLGMKKEQSAIAAAQFHLVRRFTPGFWASLNTTLYKGGRSKLDGRRLDDLQRDSKLGLTLVYPFAKQQAVKVGYSVGSVNDNDEDFSVFVVSYTRIF